MSKADDLLREVLENPDNSDALLVYADWLNESSDERASYVRGQHSLRIKNHFQESELALLRSTYPDQHLPWVNSFEQSGIFCSNLCRVDLASVNHVGRQESNSIRFQTLPPFNTSRLGSNLAWLHEEPVRKRNEHTEQSADEMADWAVLIDSFKRDSIRFPETFEMLMVDTKLQSFLPSSTDDYFLTPGRASQLITQLNDGSQYLPFYADSQWAVVYGLRLGPSDERYTPVLTGHPDYDDEGTIHGASFRVMASSLESFVYKMWIENHIWYANSRRHQRELNDEESRYWQG